MSLLTTKNESTDNRMGSKTSVLHPLKESILFATGKIVSKVVPEDVMFGTKLGKWYERNLYHKFDRGDILILKGRNLFGYGIRPVAVVEGYEIKKGALDIKGRYSIMIHGDTDGNFENWMKHNIVPKDTTRTINLEIHFKWNIEYHFKKVNVKL